MIPFESSSLLRSFVYVLGRFHLRRTAQTKGTSTGHGKEERHKGQTVLLLARTLSLHLTHKLTYLLHRPLQHTTLVTLAGTAYAVPQYHAVPDFFVVAPSDEKTVIG
jgi:hypothetical protein